MFINLSKTKIALLKKNKVAVQISRWDSIEKAEAYYSKMNGIYTAYKEDVNNLKTAFSTPVIVFMLKDN